jgi:LasA protease
VCSASRLRATISRLVLILALAAASCSRQVPRLSSSRVSSSGTPGWAASEDVEPSGSVPTLPYPGTYSGTPTPNPVSDAVDVGHGLQTHIVGTGETLTQIAVAFGSTVEEIVAANGLLNSDQLSVGQQLIIPGVAARVGPSLKLIPDSELVYGPAFVYFDLGAFVAGHGGYLAQYSEEVEGKYLSGTDVVQLVMERFSVGPRVLLALLESQSGWVTTANPAYSTLTYPLGHVEAYYEGLYQQLGWAAVRLNEGYYGLKRGEHATVLVGGGVRAALAPGVNPGTAGLQNCLAALSDSWEQWIQATGPSGVAQTYQRMFGNPFAYAVEPLVPDDLRQPELYLPWEYGTTWYYTGGPHGGWASGSGRAALDFVPGERIPDCSRSEQWVTASAPGLVIRSENGEVQVDLDGDGYEQTGWALLYMHVEARDRVPAGVFLERGQRIGHPSCEGGFADATHLHFARRYNGEWIPAGSGNTPMVLSGWTAHDDVMPYDGTMDRGNEVRTALEQWNDDLNGIVSDNLGP